MTQPKDTLMEQLLQIVQQEGPESLRSLLQTDCQAVLELEGLKAAVTGEEALAAFHLPPTSPAIEVPFQLSIPARVGSCNECSWRDGIAISSFPPLPLVKRELNLGK